MAKYIAYLHKAFTLFITHNINIKPIKTFLGYTKIDLLDQQMNFIGLPITKTRLEAITKLKFPSIILHLEIFLGMTKYLQKFIPK